MIAALAGAQAVSGFLFFNPRELWDSGKGAVGSLVFGQTSRSPQRGSVSSFPPGAGRQRAGVHHAGRAAWLGIWDSRTWDQDGRGGPACAPTQPHAQL